MIELNVFIYSFALYSLFRLLDTESTRMALKELNLEMHEVNFIAVPLIRKMGFNKAMILTWFIFATLIAAGDALFVSPLVGFPTLCILLGLFQALAAANNVQVYFQTLEIGAENVERSTRNLIRKLRTLSAVGRIVYLMKLNFLHLFLTIFGLTALALFSILLSTLSISLTAPTSYLVLIVPPVMILDLILFFPVMVFGSIVISYRRARILNSNDLSKEDGKYVSIPIDILRTALSEAEKKGAEFAQFSVSEEDL